MSQNNMRNTLFAIVTLAPFVTFAVIEFAPWWVSTPFTIIAAIWWAGSFLMLGQIKNGGPK